MWDGKVVVWLCLAYSALYIMFCFIVVSVARSEEVFKNSLVSYYLEIFLAGLIATTSYLSSCQLTKEVC